MAVDVLNLGPTAWPALPSQNPRRHDDAICRDAESGAAANILLTSDIQGIDTHIPRQDTPLNNQITNHPHSKTTSNKPLDPAPAPLSTSHSKNIPKPHDPEDPAISTIRQFQDQITANTIAIAALNENTQTLQYQLHAQMIKNQSLVIRNAELEAEIKEIREAALETQDTVGADLVIENEAVNAKIAETKGKPDRLRERQTAEQASAMVRQGEFLSAPEVEVLLLSPLSASFVPAGGGEVEETCSSRLGEEEALWSEQGVKWEGASGQERIVRMNEAMRLKELSRAEQAAHFLWMENAAPWVDLLVSEEG